MTYRPRPPGARRFVPPVTVRFDPARLMSDRAALGAILPFCREVMRRKKHPYYHWKPDNHPQRNQLGFHQSPAMIRLLFGGNQSGKSRTAAREAIYWLTRTHPWFQIPEAPRIYVISASYRTIQEGILRHLKTDLPEWEIERYGPQVPGGWQIPSFIRTRAGGQIDFISGDGKEDARKKVQAAEVDLALVDEEVDILIWEELMARRLAREGRIVVSATLVRGEEWCTQLEERADAGDPDVQCFRLSTYRARDQGHVSAKVVREMEAGLPESERKVRLEGQSRRLEDRVYPEFGTQHVIDPFEIPKDWTRYCAIDPGWRTFAVLWAAVAPDGNYVIYRELYEHAAHYSTIASMWHAAMGYRAHPERDDVWLYDPDRTERVEINWIDPSAFGHEVGGEEKVGNLLVRDFGMELAPARNGVEAGIEMCRASLMAGLGGAPRVRIFRTCQNLIKEILAYRRPKDSRDPAKAEKTSKPIKRKDHAADCWRYLELGGLEYRPPPDPYLTRRAGRESEQPPILHGATRMPEVVEDNWRRLMARQRGQRNAPAHVAGLGSEY